MPPRLLRRGKANANTLTNGCPNNQEAIVYCAFEFFGDARPLFLSASDTLH